MFESLPEVYSFQMPDLLGKAFGALEVALLTMGVSAVLVALRVAKEFSIGKISLNLPTRPVARWAWGLTGAGLMVVAFLHAEPRWEPVVVVERVWSHDDKKRAVELASDGQEGQVEEACDGQEEQVDVDAMWAVDIASDGDELYVLTRNGNVWRQGPSGVELIDNGTRTRRIVVTGGVLYVLKRNGNIWSGLLHGRLEGLSSGLDAADADGRDEPAAADATRVQGSPKFTLIDSGTNTASIAASGVTLYILKSGSGALWRRQVYVREADPEKLGDRIDNEYVRVVDGSVAQITTSGTVLYYLTKDGEIRALFPLPEAQESSFEKHVNAALAECGRAIRIAVDGRKVYFLDPDGNAGVCVDGRRESIFRAYGEESVIDLDVQDGIVYLLTSRDEVVRYLPEHRAGRFPAITKEARGISKLVATARGAYVIDGRGDVWRLSESLRKQT